MPFDNKLLAQARPADANAATLYNPSVITNIHTIEVCNTTSLADTFSIFHDDGGTTYDQTTAKYYAVAIAANTTVLIEYENPITMIDTAGNIGIQSGTGNAITYSLYGETKII